MSSTPFEIIRWDAPDVPDLAFWEGWMRREKTSPQLEELANGTHTAEVKFDQAMVRVLVKGSIQCSFPGYGVVELSPGDCLEIAADIQHDLKVVSREGAVLLSGFRPNAS